MILNENNIQSPFQYKISENSFELKIVSGGFLLNTNNVQVKVFEGQRLFCADIGYAIDGAVEEMEFLIDSIKVYPVVLDELEDLQTVDVKDNEIYLIKNEIDFKSIVFFPPIDLNKRFDFTITTYSSTFSSFMFDEIAKKLNSLDINYPVKNYYRNTDYKVNDIIKNNGYLYRVFKDFTSDDTDYYLKNNCNLLTPFKKLELDTDYKANELIEYENNFFIVQQDFSYNQTGGILTNLNGLLKPLQDIIIWFDGISKIYKNQIIIKDNFSYIVLEDIENPVWGNIQSKLDYFNKAENIFYDDSNSGFGNNTNTVQKAIEKLKSGKQDSLKAGNSINLNGSNISVIGGTSKEYILENNYFINDLIVKDEKIYKVNEDFISTDWSTDRPKLTLISSGGSGGATDAIDISYDNSKTKLEYLSGYDFPKFKLPIADTNTINISYDRANIPSTFNKVA
ncbi:phage tail protein, partial [Brachyspira intermedia]